MRFIKTTICALAMALAFGTASCNNQPAKSPKTSGPAISVMEGNFIPGYDKEGNLVRLMGIGPGSEGICYFTSGNEEYCPENRFGGMMTGSQTDAIKDIIEAQRKSYQSFQENHSL